MEYFPSRIKSQYLVYVMQIVRMSELRIPYLLYKIVEDDKIYSYMYYCVLHPLF